MLGFSEATYRITIVIDNSASNVLSFDSSWNATVLQDLLASSSGPCPVGRYCPTGVGPPLLCASGTYSAPGSVGRVYPCVDLCPANSYCTDPAVALPCPVNTHSLPGAKSKGDCLCNDGFVCSYTKQTQVEVLLHMQFEAWRQNTTMQNLLRQAVAQAAGVDSSSVVIDHALPHGSTGGLRRIFGVKKLLRVKLTVRNKAASLERLDWHLREVGGLRSVHHHSQVIDHVLATRKL